MLIVDTTIPWTSEWLIYYEIWRATGDLYGGGEAPSPEDLDPALSNDERPRRQRRAARQRPARSTVASPGAGLQT